MLLPGANIHIVPDKLGGKLSHEMYMLSTVSTVKLEQTLSVLHGHSTPDDVIWHSTRTVDGQHTLQ